MDGVMEGAMDGAALAGRSPLAWAQPSLPGFDYAQKNCRARGRGHEPCHGFLWKAVADPAENAFEVRGGGARGADSGRLPLSFSATTRRCNGQRGKIFTNYSCGCSDPWISRYSQAWAKAQSR